MGAKAEFAAAFDAVAAAAAAPEEAAAERKRRDADEAVAAPAAVLPYPYAGLLGGVYAAQPGAIVANIAHAVPTIAATYAAAPYAAAAIPAPAVATPLPPQPLLLLLLLPVRPSL